MLEGSKKIVGQSLNFRSWRPRERKVFVQYDQPHSITAVSEQSIDQILYCLYWRDSFFFFSTFIYFRDRERQSLNRGGAERKGDTESETGSRP